MFHNLLFLPHQLYHGLFNWAPSTPPREEGKVANYSPLSSSLESPCIHNNIILGSLEALKSMSLDSWHLDVLEAFCLFWDREEQLLVIYEHLNCLNLSTEFDEEVEVE